MSAVPAHTPSDDLSRPGAASAAPRSGRSASKLAPSRERPVRGAGTVERRTLTVLVVEPDPRLRRLLEVGLSKAGFQVLSAGSAEEGMGFVGPLRPLPALVIAEASLAGARGRRFCEQLRAEPRTQGLPILALAGDEAAAALEGVDVLRKPVFVRDVVALAVLKAGKHWQERIFECDTELLPLAELVRALLAGNVCGRLALASGDQLDFKDGRVVRAAFEGTQGEAALRRILLFGKGAFTVRLGPITPAGDFSLGLRELCRTALPRVRRFERILPRSLPLDARLALDLSALVRQLDQLPAEVEQLARLFDGHRSVRDALMDVEMDEPMALEALTRLYELSVLVPAPARQTPRREVLALATSGTTPDVLDGLPPEALRQLEAFRIRTVSDKPKAALAGVPRSAPVLELFPGARPQTPERNVAKPLPRARLPEAAGAVPQTPSDSAGPHQAPMAPSAPEARQTAATVEAPRQRPFQAPLAAVFDAQEGAHAKRGWALGAALLAAAGLLAATALVRGKAPITVNGVRAQHERPVPQPASKVATGTHPRGH